MPLVIRKSPWFVAAALVATVIAPVWGQEKPLAAPAVAKPIEAAEGKAIDLVICLDVSGSMGNLIDSAKLRLWDIANELARLKPTPNLRVALYSYGNSTNPDKGFVKKEIDLTEDLDDVYKALNSLKIGGSTELVARVTKSALDEQKWSQEKDALKLIFVCGNEPVDQDKQFSLDDVAANAKRLSVTINTIYCSWGHDDEMPAWARFAELCGGRHTNISMNKAIAQVAVKTEFDEEIVKLGDELNKTYVAYGKDGKLKAENQVVQDQNAANAKGGLGAGTANAVARAETKAGALYRNATWDLVDRMKEKDFDITKIKEEDLCDELKAIKPEARLEFLKKKSEERGEIQKKISELSAKRQKKLDEEQAKKPKSDAEKALDEALKTVIREQAKSKGFETQSEKK